MRRATTYDSIMAGLRDDDCTQHDKTPMTKCNDAGNDTDHTAVWEHDLSVVLMRCCLCMISLGSVITTTDHRGDRTGV